MSKQLSKIYHWLYAQLSPLWVRLGQSVWLLLIIFISQLLVSAKFIYASGGGLDESASTIALMAVLAKAGMRVLSWSILFSCITAIYRSVWWRRSTTIISLVILGAVLVLELFLIERYGTAFTYSITMIMAGTNTSEASEWFQSSLSLDIVLTILAYLLVLSLVGYGLYRATYELSHRTTRRIGASIMMLSIAVFLTEALYSIPRTYDKVMRSGQPYDYTISGYDRILWNSIGFIHELRYIEEQMAQIQQTTIADLHVTQELEPHTIVVVLGETLRRDYMQCYGFPLENTPHLDSLVRVGELIQFTDVVSPAPNTQESLTKILTYSLNSPEQDSWYRYPSMMRTFSQAGYWVEWTSNQESSGLVLQQVNVLANLSDHVHYVNARSIDAEHDKSFTYFDEDVLPHLMTQSDVSKHNLLQIVHLMGSHHKYERRFPPSYNRFTPQDLPVKRDPEKDQTIANYINSIYYNDYVVSEIVKRYRDENALVIYFSDHGEVIYDDPNNPTYIDHGLTVGGVSIPMLMYMSPKMRTTHPEMYQAILDARHRPIMLDNLTHTLTAFFGIQTSYSDPAHNFLSGEYNAHRPRVIYSMSKVFDYDQP